jgi:hypothetical protein
MNLGSPELKGLTPYQAARKLGLNKNGAEKVEKLRNGPDTL